jgi:lipopolysaccharide transport system ATP-binding protein
MSEAVVAVEGLSKVYRVYASPWDRLREGLTRRPRHREFRALEDVSFTLPHGEGLAIVGENGAGKSTLLKILAGITAPSRGQARVTGKIASILELGSGFHPDLTGRQNIVLNAAMLGLSQDELRDKMPVIVGFSELGDFIDQPVKCYSTGMAMRLGFSIATQIEPDVLIVDEALSVGDGYFQKKCVDRLLAFIDRGGTLLFCSHAMYYVSAFCRSALWLRHGRTAALGPVSEVIREYEAFLLAKSEQAAATPTVPAAAIAGEVRLPARLAEVTLLPTGSGPLPSPGGSGGSGGPGSPGSDTPRYRCGEPLELEITWDSDSPDRLFQVGVGVNRSDGVEVFSLGTQADGLGPFSGELRYRVRLLVPSLPLVKGEFALYIFLLDEGGLHIYDQRMIRRAFAVESPSYTFGLVRVEHRWEVDVERSAAVHQADRRLN